MSPKRFTTPLRNSTVMLRDNNTEDACVILSCDIVFMLFLDKKCLQISFSQYVKVSTLLELMC